MSTDSTHNDSLLGHYAKHGHKFTKPKLLTFIILEKEDFAAARLLQSFDDIPLVRYHLCYKLYA